MAASSDEHTKQLTRKLFWAVSSTFPQLTKQQKVSTFTWAADMAERILSRIHPSLPPSVDRDVSNGYHGQAEGRGGGRYDPSISRSVRHLPPPNMAAWEKQQAVLRARAWAYVLKGRENGHQLPIPASAYREVGHGSSNSSGEVSRGGPGA